MLSSADAEESLKIWSCVNCRRRKVRCDRRNPCAPCIRNQYECMFPTSGRVPRRGRAAAQKQVELVGRLRRLEAMVGDLGSQVEHAKEQSPSGHPSESPENGAPIIQGSSSNMSSDIDQMGQVTVDEDGELVVGKGFWTVFCKEVEQIFEAVNGPSVLNFDEHRSSATSSIQQHTGYYNFLRSNTSTGALQNDLHPLPSQLLFLWQIYMENIDPFLKILHVPTMTKAIRELRGSYSTLDCHMKSLALAISFAAVISLDEDEVHVNFNTDKDQLIARYRLGTEQALSQADFINTPDLVVIQALTIYLTVLQFANEIKPAWVLTGVLIRVATTMNLHRDGTDLTNLNSFETEMRRRLWWHICFIDSRSEDLHVGDFKVSESMFNTKVPANMDDVSLDSHTLRPPVEAIGWTDMTIFLLHCEIWRLSRRLQSGAIASHSSESRIGERLELFQQTQARIESNHLRYVDPSSSLHTFVATLMRLFLTKVDVILCSKHHSTAAPAIQSNDPILMSKLFNSSLLIIEYTYELLNKQEWRAWRWQIQGRQPPWYALAVVLRHLSLGIWSPIYERPWYMAKKSFESIPEASHTSPPYRKLLSLLSTARENRASFLRRSDNIPYEPALDLSGPLAQIEISEIFTDWNSEVPLVDIVDDDNFNLNFNEYIDWNEGP